MSSPFDGLTAGPDSVFSTPSMPHSHDSVFSMPSLLHDNTAPTQDILRSQLFYQKAHSNLGKLTSIAIIPLLDWSLTGNNHASTLNQNFSYVTQLEQKNQELLNQIIKISAENHTLKNINEKLISAVPGLLEHALDQKTGQVQRRNPKSNTPLNSADYPLIRYWHEVSWKAHCKDGNQISGEDEEKKQRGNTRASQGINVAMKFVEDRQGNIVNGFRADAIRKLCYRLFGDFRDEGKAPAHWSQATHEISQRFFLELADQFPEVSYCANNWKAQKIATQIYPGWHTRHCPTAIKKEAVNEQTFATPDQDLEPSSSSLGKRSAIANPDGIQEGTRRKAMKMVFDDSTNGPRQRLTIVNPLYVPQKPASAAIESQDVSGKNTMTLPDNSTTNNMVETPGSMQDVSESETTSAELVFPAEVVNAEDKECKEQDTVRLLLSRA
ncbi:hypothetical protein F5880DRAFT_1618932 [Lentinula raphanica]|nr:hypothetical protein F5880DRAFT_1618932 [Lentinula raphanica]